MSKRLTDGARAWLAVAALLIGLGFVYYFNQISDTKSERRGCERLDTLRSSYYQHVTTPGENARERNSDRQLAQDLIDSIASFPDEPPEQDVMPKDGLPDDISINCKKAWPMPWPIYLFENENEE